MPEHGMARWSVACVLLAACAKGTDDPAARVVELEAKVRALEARLAGLAAPGVEITRLIAAG